MGGIEEADGRSGRGPNGAGRAGHRRHNRLLPARPGAYADWPDWVSRDVQDAWSRRGIDRPWRHQAEAAEAAHRGRHVVLTTGTASGKSLGYLLPILAATAPVSAPAREEPNHPARGAGPLEADPIETGAAGAGPIGAGPIGAGPVGAGPVGAGPVGADLIEAVMRAGAGWRRRPHTALYLAPTKALAHDQLRRCSDLGLPGWRIAAVDGDSVGEERDWARDYASFVLTSPDLLHYSLLPQHARWRGLLQALRYVVIDEAHRYRGIFGAQVAAVLRRLRRLAAHYGATPTFVLASATAGDALGSASTLTGLDADQFEVVSTDSSARGAVSVDLWQPDGDAEDLTAELLSDEVALGRQAIAFVASRRATETIALHARAQLRSRGYPPGTVEAYRGGYLDVDRRRIESDLQSGRLRGVAATNALELGVDISGVDTVVICGYPGSRSALWQQAGRAGRRGNDASVHLVARRQPLDAYLLDHPESVFDTGSEVGVLPADNRRVLAPQLAAAAQELPLTAADAEYFGTAGMQLVEQLAAAGRLRKRPGGYYWTRPDRAVDSIDLRSARGDAVEIVEEATGRVLGHVDGHAADRVVHPGAVYLHLGESYLCEEWAPGDREALVRAARPGYFTQPQIEQTIDISIEHSTRAVRRGAVHLGEVAVTSQVTAYLRRDEVTGQVWDSTPLELPEHRTRSSALWWTLADTDLPRELSATPSRLDAALHAAEHVCLSLLPAFAPCDRWDVGSHSDPCHRGTGAATVFVHDERGGGTGIAERAFAVADEWLTAVRERLRRCDCQLGCPACILSGCGSSRGLDKTGAATLLEALLGGG